MSKGIKSLAIAAAVLACAASAHATTLTFDSLGDGSPIPNGYGGFNWSNFYTLNGANNAPSGYANGVVSSPNVAYNAYGNPASFSGAGFELVSGDFTAAWNDGLSILVQGYNGASLIDTTTFVVNTSGPTLETFDWTGLTSVTFTSSGGTHNPNLDGNGEHFALDNLSVAVPEPATWALLLVGFAGLGAVARRRRAFA
jgi:hypothetical protein